MTEVRLEAAPPLVGKRRYTALSITPEGSWVAGASSKGLVELWRMPSLTEDGITPGEGPVRIFSTSAEARPLNDIAFSPDGKQLAGVSQDSGVYLWELPREPGSARAAQAIEPARTLWGHLFPSQALAWEKDGKRLLSMGEDRRLVAFDTKTGKHEILQGPKHRFNTVAVHPTSPHAASGADDDLVWVWELQPALKLEVAFPVHKGRWKRFINRVSCVSWSPDGRMLAVSGFRDQSVHLYRFPDLQKLMEFRPLPSTITALCFGGSPRQLAVGSRAGHVGVIDLTSRQLVAAAHPGRTVTQLDWKKDFLVAATGEEQLHPFRLL